jgi:hypothetical protein
VLFAVGRGKTKGESRVMPELTYQKAILDACRKIGQILESASADASKSFEDCVPQIAQILDDLVAADRRGCAKFILGLKMNHRQQKVRVAVHQMQQIIAKKILDTIAVQMPPIVLPQGCVEDLGKVESVAVSGAEGLSSVTGG